LIEVKQAEWSSRKTTVRLPDGRALAFLDTGADKPVLVLLHGYSDSSRSYSLIEPYLHAYRLIIPDLSGHGMSEPGDGFTPDDFASDIISLLSQLGVAKFHLVGHSLGGMVSIALASRSAGAVRALVTISSNTGPSFPGDSAIPDWISAMVDPIDVDAPEFDEWQACEMPVDQEFLDHLRIEAAAMPARVWKGVQDDLLGLDLSDRAAMITCPVLCIGGEEDPLFPVVRQHRLTAAFRMAEPAAECVILPGHGHNSHWERPDIVAGLILDRFSRSV